MKDARTLEKLIKRSTTPYGTLLERAIKDGMQVVYRGDGVIDVRDIRGKSMTLYFESDDVVKENRDNGLIMGAYHYTA